MFPTDIAEEGSIIARFTFAPDRASEFIDEHVITQPDGTEIVSQPTITQLALDDVSEIIEFLESFGDAILDVSALINGQVINLSDFVNSEEGAAE